MNFVQTTDRRSLIRLMGAIYTPSNVADALARFVAEILSVESPEILEPSVGDGAFLDALADALPHARLTAIDIDEHVIDILRQRDAESLAKPEYHVGDFIEFACGKMKCEPAFDLIIGNPPFIRKHNFSDSFKIALDTLADAAHYPRTDLKNSWVSFLLACTKLVRDEGIVAFILPYEIITVAYGQAALRYLLDIYRRIDLFISDEKAFPEIDQDAIIFIGRKHSNVPDGLYVQRVRSMTSLADRIEFRLDMSSSKNLALELSSFLIPPSALPTARRLRSELPTIEDYCSSAPGIVTAANEFFILTEAKAIELNLIEYTVPILKKGSLSTRQPLFGADDFQELATSEPCRLVLISGPSDELPPALASYVKSGEKAGYHLRYKCRNRENWYQVPLVGKTTSFIFKRSHEFPRLCVNEADVYLTDTAYGLKVKPGFTDRGICYSFYNSLTLLFAETDGRFYGGGVLELSPKEFRRLPLVYQEPTEEEFNSFMAAHEKANGDITAILDFGDRWLGKKIGLNQEELRGLRAAWSAVRAHRLRHGQNRQSR